MNELIAKAGSTALKRALLLGALGAVLTSFIAVQAVTSTNLGNGSVKLATESFSDDADVSVAGKGIMVVGANASAAGASAPGVEVDNTLPAVRNALTKNNYAYEFEVKEAAVASFQSGENLKIEVYGDDGSTTTLLATLYTQQGSVDDVNVEGVTVTVDLGSTTVVHDNFDVIVTRQ